MGNITSSHDQVRFMSFADGQMDYSDNGTERSFYNSPENVNRKSSYGKLQNFHALNISLPGIPIIYYGEEIGKSIDSPADLDDEQKKEFFNWIQGNWKAAE